MNDNLYRLLQNVIRLGQIAQVSHAAPARVRVQTGDLLTNWIPWIESRAGDSRSWNPPTSGEQVLVFSPGGDLAGAVALCGVNSDDYAQPSELPEVTNYVFPDGAALEYNHASGAMKLSGIKSLKVEASDSIVFQTPSITLDADQATSTGKHTVEGLLTYLAGLSGDGGASGSTVIQGDVSHSGGQMASNGVVVHLHVHEGVRSGDDQSGGPAI